MKRDSGNSSPERVDTVRPKARSGVHPRVPVTAAPTPPSGTNRPRATADVEMLLDRAATLIDEGRFEPAARLALTCMDEAPIDPRGYLLCAISQQALGRFALAERLLRRVLLLDPESVEARLRLDVALTRSRTS